MVETIEMENKINGLHAMGYRCFMAGIVNDSDLLVAETVLKIRNHYPDILLAVVIPFAGYGDGFSNGNKERFENILRQCDAVVTIAKEYKSGCFQLCNNYLRENSSLGISYFDDRAGAKTSTADLRREQISNSKKSTINTKNTKYEIAE